MSDTQPTEAEKAKALQTAKSIMDLHPFDCGQDDCSVCPRHRNEAIDILVAYRADAVKAERERYRRGCVVCEDGIFDEVAHGVGFCFSCGGVAILSDDQEVRNG